MTSNPITIRPETSLGELQQLFEAHDFNGVPVQDDQGRLLGMATKFDVLKAFSLNTRHIAPLYEGIMAQPVSTVLVPNPETVEPGLPLSRLLQKLIEMGVKSFPVVENDRLVGIIAREDVLRALHRAIAGPSDRQEA
jgi:CBS domain-containing protein